MPKPKQNHPIQKPVTMRVSKRTYQPSVKELKEETDMPGMSLEQGQQKVTQWIYAIFAASAVSAGASATPQISPEQYAKIASLLNRLVAYFS